MDNEGVYRTGEAAARAGVSEPVLRMWERRYGLAPPARSSGGHRRYSESNVAVVRRAVELIAAGMTTDAAVTAARAEVEDPAQPSAGPRPLSEIRRRRDAAVLVRRHLVEEREALFAEREVIVHAFDTLTGRRRPPTAADAGRRRRQQRDL
ncbi:MAG TPA: MerR family transcriptional regulator [Kineosporiaceae bacterium]|nr:MerR family transcriptional regulator [Kineosporiaceae bacterium]